MKVNTVNTVNTPVTPLPFNRQSQMAQHRSKNNIVKMASIGGSALGILGTLILIGAKAKKDPANIGKSLRQILGKFNYKETDMLKLGAGSVLGGLAGGLLTDKNKNRKSKIREGIQQFFGNIAAPISLVAINEKLLEKSGFKMPMVRDTVKHAAKINNVLKNLPKIAVIFGSLIVGLELGNKLINKATNKIFKEKQVHDVEVSDYTAHLDDLCLAGNLLFRESALQGVISKVLPATFIVAGYKTGIHSPEKGHHH